MKWTFLLLFLPFITACSAGGDGNNNPDDDANSRPDALHIDFQAGFYQDTVTLFHGREKVYEKVLTTPEGKRFTDQFSFPKADLKDTLYFRVGTEKQQLKGHIPPNAANHIGFYLSSGSVVNIYSSEAPLEYH